MRKTLSTIVPLTAAHGVLAAAPVGASDSPLAKGMKQGLDGAGVGTMLLSLLLVVAMILALAWLARRMQNLPRGGRGGLKVLGGVSLGTRERAVILEFEGRRLLVGVAPGQVRLLDAIEAPASFAENLDQALAADDGESR